MTIQGWLSAFAIALTLIAYFPYLRSTLSGETKPHFFSWVLWSLSTVVVFFAQLEDGGGAGAWPIGVSGAITVLVAVLAGVRRTDTSITPLDWAFFVAALTSLPLWWLTSDPLWSVVVLTTVDLLGFGPTIRKAYDHPEQENATFFLLFAIRNAVALAALEHFSPTTVLFPIATGVACILLVGMIVQRRAQLRCEPCVRNSPGA